MTQQTQHDMGSKNVLAPAGEPISVTIERRVEESQFTDPTSEMIFRRKWAQEEKRKSQPVPFGRFATNATY